MGKELEAIKIKIEEAYKQLWHEREYAYDSKVCSKGKGWAEAIQHYDNIGKNLLEVKRILDNLLTEYEAIKNAEPNEVLECLNCLERLHDCGVFNYEEMEDYNTIKQALLKAQENARSEEILQKYYQEGITLDSVRALKQERDNYKKSLEILKKKECDIFVLRIATTVEHYNKMQKLEQYKLTQEEFSLLKEVLSSSTLELEQESTK